VVCADARSGEYLWGIDLVKEYKTAVPPWYAGQCPLIDGDLAIIAPGGESLVIAVDCATGQVKWKTPNPRQWEMTHTSLVKMSFAGKSFYIYHGSAGVAGIDAADGQILWMTDAAKTLAPDGKISPDCTYWQVTTATVGTPVICGEDRIFIVGAYDAGSMMLQLTQVDGKIVPKCLWRVPASVFESDQQTPVYYKGYIYGVPRSEQLVCLDMNGKPAWQSTARNRFGRCPFLIADGMIIVLNDDGVLTLAEASPKAYKVITSVQVFHEPHEPWGIMAMAQGRLLVRDLTRLVCLDLRKEAP
jgi:outer membrane protein assembly factor BamB